MITKKIFGYGARNSIRAIAVIMAFAVLSLAGCKNPTDGPTDDGELGTLSGNITITPDTGVITGTELTAVYSGTETVSYQWNKGGSAVSGATNNKYTPGEAGSYTVTVSAAGYNSKTSAPVTVTGAALLTLSGDININYDLTKSEITTGAELTANYSGTETVTYQWFKDGEAIPGATSNAYTPDESGSYTVTVSVAGYNPKTSNPIIVTAEELEGEVTVHPDTDVTVGMKLTASYSGDEDVNFQWKKSGAAIPGATNSEYTPSEEGIYTVTARAAGYNSKTSEEITVKGIVINPNLPTPTVDDYTIGETTFTYDGTAKEVTVTANADKSPGAVTVYYEGINGTNYAESETEPINAGTYAVTFNVAEAEGWNAAINLDAGTLTINKAAGATVSAPTAASTDATSVTLTAIATTSTDQAVEYAKNTTNTAPSDGWQTDLTFSGLTSGTTYYFFARAKADDNYETGAASSSLSVTTGLPNLAGTVSISPSSNVNTGTELTATYSGGSETITTYQWKKDGTDVGTNANKFTPTEVGSYTVTVSAAGYNSKTSTVVDVGSPSNSNFTSVTITPSASVQTGTELTASYTSVATPGTITYEWRKDGTAVGTNSNKYTPAEAGSYTVTVSATGFNPSTSTAVTVSNRTPVIGDYTVTGLAQTYNTSQRTVTITPNTGASSGARTISYEGTSGTSYTKSTTAPTNAGSYLVTFTVAAATGWNAVAGNGLSAGTLVISKATGATVAAPTVSGTPTQTSITLTAITSTTTGQTVEYSRSNAGSTTSNGTWATTTSFSGLTAGTQYYFFARAQENGNYNVGASSSGTPISTAAPLPVITIGTQPVSTTVTQGGISGSLSVAASVTQSATLSYQWYSNTTNSNSGGSTINTNGTSASFTIPTTLTAGTYYYFCEVRATNATSVRSNVATVTVNAPPNYDYIITSTSTTQFTARNRTNALIGTQNTSIQNALNAIQTDANNLSESNINIQFGDGTTALNIGTASALFTDYEWPNVILMGKITSANANTTQGTVTINDGGGSITIEGEIINTAANGNAVYNASTSNGAVTIRGGTLTATSTGYAIICTATSLVSRITLQLSPTITGRIRPSVNSAGVAALTTANTGTNIFAPGSKTYTLDYPSYTTNGAVAVLNGANFGSSFVLSGAPTGVKLVVNGANLVFDLPPPFDYIITANGSSTTQFNATRDGNPVGAANTTMANIISAIRTDAGGNACSIQFNNSGYLNIGTSSVSLSGTPWGLVTLKGMITSNNTSVSSGTVETAGNISVKSTAYITSNSTTTGNAFYHNGTGTVTIEAGRVRVDEWGTNLWAVRNNSTGTVTVNGGTVEAINAVGGGGAIYNNAGGTVNVIDGTVNLEVPNGGSDTSVIRNNNNSGTINISGGTVSATNNAGCNIRMLSGGTINITDGTITGTLNRVNATINAVSGLSVNISGGTMQVSGSSATPDNYVITGGTVNITGGTIIGCSDNPVIYDSTITLSGNPSINSGTLPNPPAYTFRISQPVTIIAPFTLPTGTVCTIKAPNMNSFTSGVVVTGGAAYSANFKMFDYQDYAVTLKTSGNDLIK